MNKPTSLPPDAAGAELRAWLQRDPPQIPPKYFYDELGSELFERITHTPEYYPTRTELALLEEHAADIVRAVQPRELAEIGSGSSRKTRLLLDAMVEQGSGTRCVVFDISADFLARSAEDLQAAYPSLDVTAVVGDFHRDLPRLGRADRRLLVFLAGTIGNLDRREVRAFLDQIRAILGPDDAFLLGVDLVKEASILEAAYDDAQGITAAFDKNMLRVVNRRFGADFDPDAFAHRAVWNAEEARVEMWLDAVRDVTVSIRAADFVFELAAGQGIRTELSCKYTRASLSERLELAGLRLDRWLIDPEHLFGLALIRTAEEAP